MTLVRGSAPAMQGVGAYSCPRVMEGWVLLVNGVRGGGNCIGVCRFVVVGPSNCQYRDQNRQHNPRKQPLFRLLWVSPAELMHGKTSSQRSADNPKSPRPVPLKSHPSVEMTLFLADFRSDVAGQAFDKRLINQCRLPMQRAIRLGPAHLAKSNGIAGGSPSKLDPAPPPARRQMAAPSMSCHLLIRSAIPKPTPAAMNIARVGWPDRHVDGVAIVDRRRS